MLLRFLFIALLAVFCGGLRAAVPPSKLTWTNGEWLTGELLEAKDGDITWRSELFAEPVVLQSSVLQRISTNYTVAVSPGDPFRVTLRDGSRLFGDLAGMNATELLLHSRRHGNVAIRSDSVLEVQRIAGGPLLYAGPSGMVGWQDSNDEPTHSSDAPQSSLAVNLWDESLFFPKELPDSVEIEFRVTSAYRPDFELILSPAAPAETSLRVEVWNDELVAVNGNDFAGISKLDASCREVAMRVFLDRTAGRFLVSDLAGKVLTDWKTPPMTGHFPGITLRNKGWDLALHSLRIRQWNGAAPRKMAQDRPRVELADDSVITGRIVRSNTQGFVVRSDDDSVEKEEPWSKLEAVVFPTDVNSKPLPAETNQVWFADGARVRGTITRIRNGTAMQQTAFSDHPVMSDLKEARLLEFHPPPKGGDPAATIPVDADEIVVDQTSLHGKWVRAGDSVVRWSLTGSRQPVRVAEGRGVRVTSASPTAVTAHRSPALVYLADGDVISGRLRDMDRNSVNFESDFAPAGFLPSSQVKAVHFLRADPKLTGFLDPGWRTMKGPESSVEQTIDTVTLQPGSEFGHPSILIGDEVSFSVEASRGGSLRVRLFSDCAGSNPRSTNMVIGIFGNTVYFGIEGSESTDSLQQIRSVSEGSFDVRLVLRESQIELFVNGSSVRSFSIPAEMRYGAGLVFEPSAMWGNVQRPVMVSGFSIHARPGAAVPPGVAGEAKAVALMVPRFLKDSPPRHMLVADNGDLLRGEIEAATASDFAFRSGLETIRVPRKRVAAAIWLAKPEEKAPPGVEKLAPPPDTVAAAPHPPCPAPNYWLALGNGARLSMNVEQMTGDAILGKCAGLGECRVPAALVSTIRNSPPVPELAARFFDDWRLTYAPEPVLPGTSGEESPLLGKDAEKFALPMLEGAPFVLAEETGRVVVLDFWATWCGPCAKSLPAMIEAMAEFPPDKVRFIGVNQAESSSVVQHYLESRHWKLATALDADQKVARKFGVEGIPQTVIIGPDGKIAWLKTGYTPEGGRDAAAAVRKLLGERE